MLEASQILRDVPPELRWSFRRAATELAQGDRTSFSKWKHLPVDPQTFFTHEYYLNSGDTIYPPVMQTLVELNCGDYDEAVLTGGIGSAKTSIAVWTQAYQTYLLSCMHNPQAYFGLDPTHEIVIIFQSLNAKLAKDLDFARFKAIIERSRYFQEQFPHNLFLDSALEFPNRIIVKPVTGAETAAIGQNVIGGIIDEVNFMSVVASSKQSVDGGTYDQAVELYNSIARRRKSRFMAGGRMPGMLCVVSSKRVPGQFTDKKQEEALTNPRIFVYDKRVWDVKPDSFCGEKFAVFIGDGSRSPRVLTVEDEFGPEDRVLIDHIPVEFRQEFADDITKALRDIAGHSTLAIHPYMPNRDAVTACFGNVPNLFLSSKVDFVATSPTILGSALPPPAKAPRFAHIDLGLTSDSAGLVIGHVDRFVRQDRGDTSEVLPHIVIDAVLEVTPPRGGEIEFANIRRVLYKLREMGLPIKWVTLDSYQSVDTMQILRQSGFVTGYCSMDTSMVPYDVTKQALYDGRVEIPDAPKLKRELLTLERDLIRGKVDHTAHGSKDLADALAGVVYGLCTRMEIWALHGIPVNRQFAAATKKKEVPA